SNLRVSSSVHTQDISKGVRWGGPPITDLDCTAYHSVSCDGPTAVHRTSRIGRTRLRNFKDNDVDEANQVHVHYATRLLTSLPSIHNKTSARWWLRRIEYSYYQYAREFKYAMNPVVRVDVEESGDDASDDEQSDDVDDENDDDFVVVDRRSVPMVVEDLSAFL
ncbi:hypothetical protein PENTCL1PPCAC_24155, partial [Pristionchus entomophagus]